MDRLLNKARKIAKDKNIINWQTLEISEAKNKRFSIMSPSGKKINFGLWPFKQGTFLDHQDTKIRDAWRARHSKILLKDKTLAYKNKESPEYYSWSILW